MASRTRIILVDDIDGTELPAGDGETVHFSLDGAGYEIDLATPNAQELRSSLEQYIRAGRRVGGRGPAPARTRGRVDREQRHAARDWLRSHGHPVSDRGRIKTDLMELYLANAGR